MALPGTKTGVYKGPLEVAVPVLESRALVRSLTGADGVSKTILEGVDLKIEAGECVALTGPAGSGKSTLLYLLAGLDRPNQGEVRIAGKSTTKLNDLELAELRSKKIGFVHASPFLLPDCSALENVLMAMRDAGQPEARERAYQLLGRLGLTEEAGHRPRQLSPGLQQRVAVAQALANQPDILLIDAPASPFSQIDTVELEDLYFHLNQNGQTIVMIPQDPDQCRRCSRELRLQEGKLLEN